MSHINTSPVSKRKMRFIYRGCACACARAVSKVHAAGRGCRATSPLGYFVSFFFFIYFILSSVVVDRGNQFLYPANLNKCVELYERTETHFSLRNAEERERGEMLKTAHTIYMHPYEWSTIGMESLWMWFANGFV